MSFRRCRAGQRRVYLVCAKRPGRRGTRPGVPRIEGVFTPLPYSPTTHALELEILERWEREGTFEQLREQNRGGPKWSFIDGPVTANKTLGVHTAWGRTLKDVFQRYKALRGFDQRYQNGFDCQGLWIEVGVERSLGLNSKREIEEFGLEEFARALPRGRRPVVRGADARLEAARPVDGLGQRLLHVQRHEHRVHLALPADRPRARLALRRPPLDRVVPALRHVALAARAHAVGRLPGARPTRRSSSASRCSTATGESLVVWTTTPWTLPANVAAAVNPEAEYGLRENGEWVAVARYPDEPFARARSAARSSSACATAGPFDDLGAGRRGRAPRGPVGRGLARGGHRHRPHRDRLRRRGLRARHGCSACRC